MVNDTVHFIIIYIFFKIIKVVISSDHTETNSEVVFCQWEVFHYSKDACVWKCLSSNGFIHPITKQLVCYNVILEAIPLISYTNDDVAKSCRCGVVFQLGTFECKPEKIFDESNIEKCLDECPKYTAFIFKHKGDTELLYCTAESSKIDVRKLGALVFRQDPILSTKMHDRWYNCKCGIGINGVQLAYKKLQKKSETVFKKVSAFALTCSEKVPYIDNSQCGNRCKLLKGFIMNSKQLICFNRKTTAQPISMNRNACQCGHNPPKSGNRDKCRPELKFDNIKNNAGECKLECSKHTVLRMKLKNGLYEIVWCGKEIAETQIIDTLKWNREASYDSEGNVTSSYECVCGVDTLERKPHFANEMNEPRAIDAHDPGKKRYEKRKIREVTPERVFTAAEKSDHISGEIDIQNHGYSSEYYYHISGKSIFKMIANSSEFVASCSLKRFKTYSKKICQNTCKKAKAFFLTTSDNNELICYHVTKAVKKLIPSFEKIGNTTVQADNVCECGTRYNEKNKNIRYSQSCIPEIKYEMRSGNNGTSLVGELTKCRKICSDHVVYVFNYVPKPEVIRCELNSFLPKTYANLDWKVEKIKKDDKERISYYCECGLTISSLNNAHSHPENFASSSHYIVRKETSSIRRGQDNLDDVVDDIPYRVLSNNTMRNQEKNAEPSNGDAICSQPVGNFNKPSPVHQPETEKFGFSTSTNANVELSDDRGMCSESVRQGEWTQRENEDIVFHNESTNNDEEREQNADYADIMMQPVEDLVVPANAVYTSEKEIGESSKFVLPDLNIPYEISTEEGIPACNTETGPDLSPAQKRMRNS